MKNKNRKKINNFERLGIFIAILSMAMSICLTLVSRIKEVNIIVEGIINIILFVEAVILFWLAYKIRPNKELN